MAIHEIIESEKRNSDNIYDIHFYLEGAFWRAYEWSGYLSRAFPSGLSEDERLKPLKRVAKGEEYIYVGLQLSSFDKYFPNVTNDDSLFKVLDNHIVIHAKTFFADANFSDYEKIFNEWKSKYSLSKNEKKKQREMNTVHSEEITIDWLIHQIISYPIEKKTLIDNTYFLSHIRESAIKVLKSEYKTNS